MYIYIYICVCEKSDKIILVRIAYQNNCVARCIFQLFMDLMIVKEWPKHVVLMNLYKDFL